MQARGKQGFGAPVRHWLQQPDVAATKAFLMTYFGLQDGGGKANLTFLRDDAGMVLTLIKAKDVSYPDFFHIGFIQPSEAAVDAVHARLRADGYEVAAPQRSHSMRSVAAGGAAFTRRPATPAAQPL